MRPAYVVVDERIVVDENKRLVFGRSTNPGEMWVQLIEKAYAKMCGGYSKIVGQKSEDYFEALTGMRQIQLEHGRHKLYETI